MLMSYIKTTGIGILSYTIGVDMLYNIKLQNMKSLDTTILIVQTCLQVVYKYVYRNYVDFEEKWLMVSKISPLHNICLYRPYPTNMTVMKNNQIIMSDLFYLFGIKLLIKWYGNYNKSESTIDWTSSSIILGLNNFTNPTISQNKLNQSWKLNFNNTFYIFESFLGKCIFVTRRYDIPTKE